MAKTRALPQRVSSLAQSPIHVQVKIALELARPVDMQTEIRTTQQLGPLHRVARVHDVLDCIQPPKFPKSCSRLVDHSWLGWLAPHACR